MIIKACAISLILFFYSFKLNLFLFWHVSAQVLSSKIPPFLLLLTVRTPSPLVLRLASSGRLAGISSFEKQDTLRVCKL